MLCCEGMIATLGYEEIKFKLDRKRAGSRCSRLGKGILALTSVRITGLKYVEGTRKISQVNS